MMDIDYLKIVIDGYIENEDFFERHILRQAEFQLEKHKIENDEFFQKCLGVIQAEIKDADNKHQARINELKDTIYGNYSIESITWAKKYLIEAQNEGPTYIRGNGNPLSPDYTFTKFTINDLENLEEKLKEISEEEVFSNLHQISTTSNNYNGFQASGAIIKKDIIDYNSIKLKDLFPSDNAYYNFEKKLISEGIIDHMWNIQGQENLDIKLVCALAYILIKDGFLVAKTNKPKYYKGRNFKATVLIHAMNNTFKGVVIATGSYSDHKRSTFNLYPDDSHLTAFEFLKNET